MVLKAPNYIALLKENKLDGTIIWSKAYIERTAINEGVINSKESDLFYIAFSSSQVLIVNLSTSDGSLTQTMKNTNLS